MLIDLFCAVQFHASFIKFLINKHKSAKSTKAYETPSKRSEGRKMQQILQRQASFEVFEVTIANKTAFKAFKHLQAFK